MYMRRKCTILVKGDNNKPNRRENKMQSQEKLIQKFVNGATEGGASNMHVEGNILYSYGRHFPLLIRLIKWGKKMFILNADRYSSSTSRHQRECFKHATIQIPFSALLPALGRYDARIRNVSGEMLVRILNEMKLIGKTAERWDTVGYYRWRTGYSQKESLTVAQYNQLTEEEQKIWNPVSERRPESAVLQFRERFFLSSMDGWNYFISELPDAPFISSRDCGSESVAHAFEILEPEMLRNRKAACGESSLDFEVAAVRRQGEWFFIPAKPVAYSRKGKVVIPSVMVQKGKSLLNKPPREGSPHHFARDFVPVGTGLPFPLVRGCIRHSNRDHRTINLGETWHYAIESNHVMSWGAHGRVD